MASGISLKRGVIVAVLVAPLLIWRGEAQDSTTPPPAPSGSGDTAAAAPAADAAKDGGAKDAKADAAAPAGGATPPAGAETLSATGGASPDGTPPGGMQPGAGPEPMGGPGAPKAPPGSAPHHAGNSNFNSQSKAELQGQKSWDDLIRVLHKAAVIRGEIAAKAKDEKKGLNDPTEEDEEESLAKETKEAGKGKDGPDVADKPAAGATSLVEAKKKTKKQAKKKTKKKHKSGSHGGAHK